MSQADVDVHAVEQATREIIKQANADGTIDELTPRLVRKRVEERLALTPGALDEDEHKARVKAVVAATMEELEGVKSEEEPNAKPARKRKSAADDVGKKPRSKVKAAAKTKEKEKAPSKRAGKGAKAKVTRSPSVIPSDSENEDSYQPSGDAAPKAKSTPAKKSKKAVVSDEEPEEGPSGPPQKRRKTSTEISLDVDPAAKPSSSRDKPESTMESASSNVVDQPSSPTAVETQRDGSEPTTAVEKDDGDKSESEMSVLIDEPPKRGRKRSGKDGETKTKAKREPKEKKSKPPAKELSKDEETVKRLKSLVVACGVRRVWAKEFKDLERPSDQIKRLKQILADLGMTGRMSLEQAKAIREKRELAQELEDVQTFAKAIETGPGSKRSRTKVQRQQQVSDDEESEAESAGAPKRRANARQSIMAFLGDQSDD
ncbi:hypothetical protein POSPLADRAFT_1073872, partial [Postia placenta MAD-698-R-SB12]